MYFMDVCMEAKGVDTTVVDIYIAWIYGETLSIWQTGWLPVVRLERCYVVNGWRVEAAYIK
jgi:hypothetical protein